MINQNGTSCDDSNSQTINEIWNNDICIDPKTNGTDCNDGDEKTTNDAWNNNVCIGKTPVNVKIDTSKLHISSQKLLSENTIEYSIYRESNTFANISKNSGKWYLEVTIHQTGTNSCPNIGVLNSLSDQNTYFYNINGAFRLGCYSVNGTYSIKLDLDNKKICINDTKCDTISIGSYIPIIGDDNISLTVFNHTPTIASFNFKGPFVYTKPVDYKTLEE